MAAGASLSRRLSEMPPYSYRDDPQVPRFPDDKGLIVFDGVCVLCTRSAQFVLKRDAAFAFRLATAQSPLGQALFRHYGLDTETFETNLVLIDGRAYAKLDSVDRGVPASRRHRAAADRAAVAAAAARRLGSTIALRSTATPCSAAPTAA